MLEELCRLWLQDSIVPKFILNYLQDEMGIEQDFSHILSHNRQYPDKKYKMYFNSRKYIWIFELLTVHSSEKNRIFLWKLYREYLTKKHLPRKKGKGHVIGCKVFAVQKLMYKLEEERKQSMFAVN